MSRKTQEPFTCERCGSHSFAWSRTLTSGRHVCKNCYSELPFDAENVDPDKRNLVVDDLRTDVPTRRKVIVRW